MANLSFQKCSLIVLLLLLPMASANLVQIDEQGNVVQSSIDKQEIREIVREAVNEEGKLTRKDIALFAERGEGKIDEFILKMDTIRYTALAGIVGAIVLGALLAGLFTYFISRKRERKRFILYERRLQEWLTFIQKRMDDLEAVSITHTEPQGHSHHSKGKAVKGKRGFQKIK